MGSRAMATAAAKAPFAAGVAAVVVAAGCLQCLPIVAQRRPRRCHERTGKGAQTLACYTADHTIARCHCLLGRGRRRRETRSPLGIAVIVVRLALAPVSKAGSITFNSAAPTLVRAEPLVVRLVEP